MRDPTNARNNEVKAKCTTMSSCAGSKRVAMGHEQLEHQRHQEADEEDADQRDLHDFRHATIAIPSLPAAAHPRAQDLSQNGHGLLTRFWMSVIVAAIACGSGTTLEFRSTDGWAPLPCNGSSFDGMHDWHD